MHADTDVHSWHLFYGCGLTDIFLREQFLAINFSDEQKGIFLQLYRIQLSSSLQCLKRTAFVYSMNNEQTKYLLKTTLSLHEQENTIINWMM